MTKIKNVGLIGAGLMGHGIGKNILAKGYALTVMGHRNRAPIEDLVGRGAKEAKSPKALAEASDLVILCVTGSPQVEDVLYRKDGLLEGMRQGLIIADCSTAEPRSTLKVAADIAGRGGRYMDTPMTRTPKEAEEGKLGLIVGGEADLLEEIRPVLSSFAEIIVHAGKIGAGHQLKLFNNFLSLGTAALVAEAIAAAGRAGLDMQAFYEVISGGGANSVMFQRLVQIPLKDDDTTLRFTIRNARKDLRYYTNLTEELPVTSFIAEAVHQTYALGDNCGFGDRFVPRLIDALKKVNSGG